ncbi:MAG: ribosome maturation factor RimP [Candidatus Krumholzibacteria bacterium]|nr:ribosome maturation factor RimP [Candidatus Krumholzibacteria bacterium]MDH4336494.1 ribosome maturation factor RimP [Candidatus Krumholzibacteria bacterium]MDH5269575.1 ribosome maturation factor RimP [Candidatus Krumholzibacteria bacterium]MDH5627535.1 ribosome maturation factor RimP [Candidatus Krumholzibacteria bacterium]
MKEAELEKVIAPELELLGFECVKLEVVGGARSPILRIFIDKPGGVTVGECSFASRTIAMMLERDEPFPGRYLLEVSSPGSNRPLVREEHYQRFAGQEAKVVVERPGEGRITYTGTIRSCINGVLTLDIDGGEISLALHEVARANLVNQEYKIDKKREKDRRPSRAAWRRGEE